MISNLQRMLRVAADGLIGPTTIKAMQGRYGVTQDGVLDEGSLTIMRLQAELNAVNGY